MVEQTLYLNNIFASLADPTRRDILRRVIEKEFNISELSEFYDMSFAAVAKHLKVLEKARLIIKKPVGKNQMIEASPVAIKEATIYLKQYEKLWNERFDKLEQILKE